MKKFTFAIILCALAVLVIYFLIASPKYSEIIPAEIETYPTEQVSNWKKYTSKEPLVSFMYPNTWYIEEGDSDAVSVTLYNYNVNQALGGHMFRDGNMKIAVYTSNSTSIFSDEEYAKSVKKSELCNLECYEVLTHVTPTGDSEDKVISYVYEIQNKKGTYLSIVLYGDNDNKWILEEIVKSVKWIR